jgi:hypothetical protein
LIWIRDLIDPNIPPDGKDMPQQPHQSEAIDEDGFLIDMDVQPIPNTTDKLSLKDQSRNVNHFFTPPFHRKGKNYRNCRICL